MSVSPLPRKLEYNIDRSRLSAPSYSIADYRSTRSAIIWDWNKAIMRYSSRPLKQKLFLYIGLINKGSNSSTYVKNLWRHLCTVLVSKSLI
jgi:hypothetical protein